MRDSVKAIRDQLEPINERIDEIGDEIETSREDLRAATLEHNARVGVLERERERLAETGGELRRAIRAIEPQNVGNGSDL